MRAASYYYLAQTWPHRSRQTRPGTLRRAGYQARHARPHLAAATPDASWPPSPAASSPR